MSIENPSPEELNKLLGNLPPESKQLEITPKSTEPKVENKIKNIGILLAVNDIGG